MDITTRNLAPASFRSSCSGSAAHAKKVVTSWKSDEKSEREPSRESDIFYCCFKCIFNRPPFHSKKLLPVWLLTQNCDCTLSSRYEARQPCKSATAVKQDRNSFQLHLAESATWLQSDSDCFKKYSPWPVGIRWQVCHHHILSPHLPASWAWQLHHPQSRGCSASPLLPAQGYKFICYCIHHLFLPYLSLSKLPLFADLIKS